MSVKKYLLTTLCSLISYGAFAQSDITENEIAAHISFLASKKMAGRFPGTRENKKTVDYLIKNFRKAGIKPFRAS